MRYRTSPGYERDIRRTRNRDILRRVDSAIADLGVADSIGEVRNIERVRSARGQHYRIRVGNYRIGVTVVRGMAILSKFGHRRDFYRRFP